MITEPGKNKIANVSIRQATSLDVPMMQKFIFEHGPNPWNYLPEEPVKAHIAEISTKHVQGYLAEANGECLGFALFYLGLPPSCQKYEEHPNQVAYLSEIVVHRDHAGQGIGSKLINRIKEHLISHKIKRLYAERHSDNINSAGVMAKTGFNMIDEYCDEQRRPTGSRKTTVTRLEL